MNKFLGTSILSVKVELEYMYNLEMEQNMKWVQICKRTVKQYYSHLISTYIIR